MPDAPATIILIRHGEKPGDNGPPHGVDRHGDRDEHSLSVRGWTRAGALAAVLAAGSGTPGRHPAAPARIVATRPTAADPSTRERDTATPTALRLGLEIEEAWTHGAESEMAAAIISGGLPTLVVWHHGRLADVARSFPLANPQDVPGAWPSERFDLYWILVREADGYRFTVVPQLLLAGDEDVTTAPAPDHGERPSPPSGRH